MNQHFIYNTLNQVQYFIHKGEKEASLSYIIKLSRLLRQWMHDTGKSSVPVTDEISLLSAYLTLEQLRFADRFSFEVVTDVPQSGSVFITPHLIFPLAEHAVSWCLRQKEAGHICIRMLPDAPFLQCMVVAQAGGESLAANLHLVPQLNNISRLCNVSSL